MATARPIDDERNVSTWQRINNWLPFPFGDHPWWIDGTTRAPDEKDENPRLWREGVINIFDHNGFDFQVFIVAASGFLTDSYSLFATNVILPLLAFLYWPDRADKLPELYINVATLAGSVVGQLLFGWLTDRLGRRKLYGLELVLVIFATLGMSQASNGMYNNMNILSWMIFYRFFLGMGIGAEYPLSAVITAEFASTKYRARMMAAVFLMQPLGQVLAAAIGWGVLTGLMQSRGLQGLPDRGAEFDRLPVEQQHLILATLDSVWRWVVGAGCIPALLAILWRFSIPESPRYTMDVAHDPKQAIMATKRQFRRTAQLLESLNVSSDEGDTLAPSNPRSFPTSPALTASPDPIPAEIFPTRFRATCHGISAACGKLGAIVILILTEKTILNANPRALDKLLGAFSVPLAAGAFFAWIWIPDLQTPPTGDARALRLPRLPNKSLEMLARGWTFANGTDQTQDPRTRLPKGENQRLGFSNKLLDAWVFLRYRGKRRVLGTTGTSGRRAGATDGPIRVESNNLASNPQEDLEMYS
ncbi:hypothetical protein PoHVEF18_008363 [Penicillium ochrochloron]